MDLRGVSPTPRERGRPSVKLRSGWWQVEHDTAPFALRRASKKSLWPSRAAAGSSAKALPGSGGGGGRRASERDDRASFSCSVQLGAVARSSAANPSAKAASLDTTTSTRRVRVTAAPPRPRASPAYLHLPPPIRPRASAETHLSSAALTRPPPRPPGAPPRGAGEGGG